MVKPEGFCMQKHPGYHETDFSGHCLSTIGGKRFFPGGFMDHIDNALIRYVPVGASGLDLGW